MRARGLKRELDLPNCILNDRHVTQKGLSGAHERVIGLSIIIAFSYSPLELSPRLMCRPSLYLSSCLNVWFFEEENLELRASTFRRRRDKETFLSNTRRFGGFGLFDFEEEPGFDKTSTSVKEPEIIQAHRFKER
jgi:hypothetical protein